MSGLRSAQTKGVRLQSHLRYTQIGQDQLSDHTLLQGDVWRGGNSSREQGSVPLHEEDGDPGDQPPPGVPLILTRVPGKCHGQFLQLFDGPLFPASQRLEP